MQINRKIKIIALTLVLSLLVGCAPQNPSKPDENAQTTLNVYTTFYPLYAIADMLVCNTDVQLNCLVQPQDGCLRSYSLSDWDLALLSSSADLVIAGGCGLESFENLLYALGDEGPVVSSVLYDMELRKEKAINSSQDRDSHWLDENPHIYLSIDGAIEIAERIAAALTVLDTENQQVYSENLANAQNKLHDLQEDLHKSLSTAKKRRVIVMNEALVYAAEEYGLKVDLYYERESGEAIEGADWENCLDALNKSDARIVLLEKQAPARLMDSLQDAGFIVAALDTMSTRSATEGSEGYFAAHQENVRALLEAFNEATARF